MKALADSLMAEIARVRDDVLPRYTALEGLPGVNVSFAVAGMRRDLDAATRALAEQDAVECLRLLDSLRGWTT